MIDTRRRTLPRDKSIGVRLLGMLLFLSGCGGGGDGTPQPNSEIPSMPDGLSAQVISSSQINLDWNPATDDVAVLGYYVYQGGDIMIANAPTYVATALSPATQYCFSVAAFDADGNVSPQTAAVCATTQSSAASAWTTVRSGTSNDLSNIVWTGSQLVAVEETLGNASRVKTSLNGLAWSDFPTSGFGFNGARDMVYGNNRFVAIDVLFYTSPDGIAWQLTGTDSSAANALAWSPTRSLYVAVGDNGYISTSTDGSSWNHLDPAPTTTGLHGVSWLNGRFYAVGETGTILTSINGVDWLSATTPASTYSLESVTWNGQSGIDALYVATGYGTVFISSDGDTWTEVNTPPLGFNDSVVWGGGSANCFVVVGKDNHIFSSPDGENWTRRFLDKEPAYSQLSLNEVVWTGARFVVVGQMGSILASDDGLTWRIVQSGADLYGLAHDGNRFITVGANGRVAIASDVGAWEYRHTGDDSHYPLDLVWNGSRYLAVGQRYTLRSDNLATWQASWEGATNVDTAVVWDGGQFVKTTLYGILIWDGVTMHSGTSDPWWKYSLFDNSNPLPNLLDIVWTASQFVAVGDNGRIYTSPDATESSTWTVQASGTTSRLEAVAHGPGRFVAVGAAGTILTSDDAGVSWTLRSSGVSDAIYDVTWTGSEFVAVGQSGLILTSADGNAWNATDHENNDLHGVLGNGNDIVIVGAKGTIIRNNP